MCQIISSHRVTVVIVVVVIPMASKKENYGKRMAINVLDLKLEYVLSAKTSFNLFPPKPITRPKDEPELLVRYRAPGDYPEKSKGVCHSSSAKL